MDNEKTLILGIDLNVDALLAHAKDAKQAIDDLKKQQQDLIKTGQGASVQFEQNAAKIRELNVTYKDITKVIDNTNKARKEEAGSIAAMRAELALATVKYNSLGEAQRDSTEEGLALGISIKDLSDKLKQNESAIGDNRRNVGNYAGAMQELKAELKAARGELVGIAAQFGETSPQYVAAAKHAGELNDKIKDINNSIKASTGKPLEQLGGDVQLLKDKVLGLDFGGISTQLNSIAGTVKNISFKSLIAGTDGLGASFKNLAISILSNPLFLIGAAIAAIVYALYQWNEAEEENARRVAKANADKLDSLKEYGDYEDRLAKAHGLSAESQTKIHLNSLKEQKEQALAERNRLQNKESLNEDEVKAYEKVGKDLIKINQETTLTIAQAETDARKKKEEADKKAAEDKKKKGEDDKKAAEEKVKLDQQTEDLLDKAHKERFLKMLKDEEDAYKESEMLAKEAADSEATFQKAVTQQRKKDFQEQLDALIESNRLKETYINTKEENDIQKLEDEKQKVLDNTMLTGDEQIKITQGIEGKITDIKKAALNARLQGASTAFGNLASLEEAAGTGSKIGASAQALISTYLSAQESYKWGAIIGGPILGGVFAAIATAAGLANVAKINAVKFQDGGLPRGERGLLIGGNYHSSGGTKFWGEDGTAFEAERDEALFVINRRSTAMMGWLNGINMAGGGVNALHSNYLADGGFASRSAGANVQEQYSNANRMRDLVESLPRPVVYVESISNKVDELNEIEARSSV